VISTVIDESWPDRLLEPMRLLRSVTAGQRADQKTDPAQLPAQWAAIDVHDDAQVLAAVACAGQTPESWRGLITARVYTTAGVAGP
jgi:hypothetical protein